MFSPHRRRSPSNTRVAAALDWKALRRGRSTSTLSTDLRRTAYRKRRVGGWSRIFALALSLPALNSSSLVTW